MRVVLQKVSEGSVTVDQKVLSSIKHGYTLLVGISTEDTIEDIERISNKIMNIKIFDDGSKNWKKNIKEVDGEILSISQFTLMARIKKGSKPDFHMAQKGPIANELYKAFLQNLRDGLGHDKVKDGLFGAIMSCSLTNEGPVTIILDTKDLT